MERDELNCVSCRGCATCSLDCLQIGCRARVICVNGDREFRRRLMEMGFCNDVRIEMVGRSPFGDPIEFRLRGYQLCLRNEQAKNVLVAIEGSEPND